MRPHPSWELEETLFGRSVVGVDEVGRGAVAGPLVVCALRFNNFPEVTWRDSKQMSPLQRRSVFSNIVENSHFGIGLAAPWDIDRLGINFCLRKAAEEALGQVPLEDAMVVFDGKKPLTTKVPAYQCMVKGDTLLPSVAAASVVAKVIRDEIMVCLDSVLPGYGFSAHKGYGTPKHLEAIECLGVTAQHRRSFLRKVLEQALF